MKNWKVSVKLMVSFAIITVLAIVIGIVGIIGMSQINSKLVSMYETQTKPLPEAGKALEYLQRLRVQLRNVVFETGNPEAIAKIEGDIKEREDKFIEHMVEYEKTIVAERAKTLWAEAMDEFKKDLMPGINAIVEGAKRGEEQSDLRAMMSVTGAAADSIVEKVDELMSIKIQLAATANSDAKALSNFLLTLIVVVLLVSIAIAAFFAMYVTNLISKPIKALSSFMGKAGSTGDLTMSPEEARILNENKENKDEVGVMTKDCVAFIEHVVRSAKTLETIAGGDFTPHVHLASDRDSLGNSLKRMLKSFNEMFGEINVASVQVNSGGMQVSGASQALSQGATEQASAVQQLSASIHEISNQVKENSTNSNQANDLVQETTREVQRGNEHMQNMLSAMTEINSASSEISKIIKVIDDIAFQTNILALNAAVEAARAGSAGKGFAVVAEEVRNLASKSADAAKHTTALIEGSIASVEKGATIAQDTARSLESVAEKTREVEKLIDTIARASSEQADGIRQINTGVDQISQVIQTNSATAEQSAAASEELSSQANLLQEQVGKLKLNEHSSMGMGGDW